VFTLIPDYADVNELQQKQHIGDDDGDGDGDGDGVMGC